jgi:glycosyltransferase involved in cell wall biosynthesis
MQADSGLPKWFASPIIEAGYRVHFSRSFWQIRSIIGKAGAVKPLVLVFNIALLEYWVALFLSRRCRIVSLFQWRKLENLSVVKRFIYRTILASSDQILVYSRMHEDYIRARFPRAKVSWIGLYTDTHFFQPQTQTVAPAVVEPYLLVPGNHKRNEQIVFEIAETLRMPIVRFSSEPLVAREYALRQSPYVKFLANCSFEQIRSLYQQSAAILIIADDSEWPVGITSFCEALAMNAIVVTPSGNSASGYEFEDGIKPYYNVPHPGKVSDWCNVVRAVLQKQTRFPADRSPRKLAEKLCSIESTVRSWSALSAVAKT